MLQNAGGGRPGLPIPPDNGPELSGDTGIRMPPEVTRTHMYSFDTKLFIAARGTLKSEVFTVVNPLPVPGVCL